MPLVGAPMAGATGSLKRCACGLVPAVVFVLDDHAQLGLRETIGLRTPAQARGWQLQSPMSVDLAFYNLRGCRQLK